VWYALGHGGCLRGLGVGANRPKGWVKFLRIWQDKEDMEYD
jgi:hypothetical protein